MRPAPSAVELSRFRAALARHLGWHLEELREPTLREALQRRLAATESEAPSYLARLEERAASSEELRALAEELAIGETYFFRHADQFRAFAEVALPARVAARGSPERLQLLSAACSSGEEPYTLAILLRERYPALQARGLVRAVDLNATSLERAARGRFGAWSLRETPAELRRRWFTPRGGDFDLDPSLLPHVSFEARNLASEHLELWQPEHFDVIFCRNALMYFRPEVAQRVLARLVRALAPGGFLFVGHAETVRGFDRELELLRSHETFYYQRRASLLAAPLEEPPTPRRAPLAAAPAQDATSGAVSWIDAILRATNRIRALTQPSPLEEPEEALPAPPVPAALESALAELRQERYEQALAHLDALPEALAHEPSALLLRAVLLSHAGRRAEAEQACSQLLARDDDAGAHYLLALCREAAGDRAGALEHARAALRADPGFAMARLQLGLLARRMGDRETARRELGRAELLLQREGAARLELFSSGFGREALLALCRAELLAGGAP